MNMTDTTLLKVKQKRNKDHAFFQAVESIKNLPYRRSGCWDIDVESASSDLVEGVVYILILN